ncbi:MAG: ABC transporter substrate-binding protein [Anaerolineae bacterium]|nr:ABC transporter substrate-binding protein [Thermoflexales bacterium]MDW8396461.1 ABC transporter substrate-binding protein [Anaerolineae bacterium]
MKSQSFFALVASAIVLSACGAPQAAPQPAAPAATAPAASAERARTLILAMPSLPVNLDPGVATSGAENMLHRALYEGLVNFKGASTTEVEPVLAESFEPNADRSVWTFKLRRGVKFTDGADFNAEALKIGYKRMVDIGLLGNTINRFTSGDVENNLVVKDEYTLEWRCGFSCPDLPLALGTAYGTFVVSPKALKENEKIENGKSDHAMPWFERNAAGTGPYMIESLKPNEEIVFVRNPNYWRGWGDDKQRFERIIIRNVPEPSTRRQLLERGDADISLITTVEDYKALRATGRFQGSDKPLFRINYIVFTKRGVLKDPRVRQAIAYAFDYEGYANNVEGGLMRRGTSPWPSGMRSAVGTRGFQYTYDPEKARALLKEAGVPEGTELTYMYATGYGYYERMGLVLQAGLEQIGLKLRLEERDEAAFNDIFYGNRPVEELPDMMGYAWWPDYDDFYNYVNPVFHTRNEQNDGLGNGARYSNPELDALIQQSKFETDPAKLKAIYERAHQILMFEDPAAIYVAEPQEEILIVNSVKGHPWNPIHVKTFDFYSLYRE